MDTPEVFDHVQAVWCKGAEASEETRNDLQVVWSRWSSSAEAPSLGVKQDCGALLSFRKSSRRSDAEIDAAFAVGTSGRNLEPCVRAVIRGFKFSAGAQ